MPVSDAAPNLKNMLPEQRDAQINNEFMDYMEQFITKNNSKSLPGTVNHARAEEARRKLLNQIKHGEDKEDFEPDVVDIANYVHDQLKIGWKTVHPRGAN